MCLYFYVYNVHLIIQYLVFIVKYKERQRKMIDILHNILYNVFTKKFGSVLYGSNNMGNSGIR